MRKIKDYNKVLSEIIEKWHNYMQNSNLTKIMFELITFFICLFIVALLFIFAICIVGIIGKFGIYILLGFLILYLIKKIKKID